MNSGIRINYPRTKYLEVNNLIASKVRKIVEDYIIVAAKPVFNDKIYTLDIAYEDYTYQHIESFVFFVSTCVEDLKLNNFIFTINYDTNTNKIITIDHLVKNNEDILNLFYKEMFTVLGKSLSNDDIRDKNPLLKDNFANFVFTPQGIKLYILSDKLSLKDKINIQVLVNYNKINNFKV